jgi:hypothetical protein
MFIGWIRKKSFYDDLVALAKKITIDQNLITKTVEEDQSLSFGIYENNELLGIITAYRFENSVLINNLYYIKELEDEVIQRVFKILLNNLYEDTKPILFLASKSEKQIVEKLGFLKYADFKKAVHSGAGVAFNFSNATAKSISNENYLGVLKQLDQKGFGEQRVEYVTKSVMKSSSLVFSTQFAFQHSYALNQNIVKISPWIVEPGAYTDAEKLLRGVLYHRGLKTLVAFVPKNNKEITDLYQSYKFELVDDFSLMYLNNKPNIDLNYIYGF